MIVIGVTGKAVSGKSTAASYISRKYGFRHLDFTKDLLAPMLEKQGKAVSRKNLIKLGLKLREGTGKDALIRLLAEKIKGERGYVIAGLRYPEEVNYLRKRFGKNFFLIGIKCGVKTRYNRTVEIYEIKKKYSKDRDITFKEFLKIEDMPTEKIISRTLRMADFYVVNEGTKREMYSKIDRVMKKIISKGLTSGEL